MLWGNQLIDEGTFLFYSIPIIKRRNDKIRIAYAIENIKRSAHSQLQTVVLKKTLESCLDNKEVKSLSPKGNQPWLFIGRTDAEAAAQIVWPSDVKGQLTGKDTVARKDWGQEKGAAEDEMVGWHHWLNGHESEQTPEDGEGQGSLGCCSPWGSRELDMT